MELPRERRHRRTKVRASRARSEPSYTPRGEHDCVRPHEARAAIAVSVLQPMSRPHVPRHHQGGSPLDENRKHVGTRIQPRPAPSRDERRLRSRRARRRDRLRAGHSRARTRHAKPERRKAEHSQHRQGPIRRSRLMANASPRRGGSSCPSPARSGQRRRADAAQESAAATVAGSFAIQRFARTTEDAVAAVGTLSLTFTDQETNTARTVVTQAAMPLSRSTEGEPPGSGEPPATVRQSGRRRRLRPRARARRCGSCWIDRRSRRSASRCRSIA